MKETFRKLTGQTEFQLAQPPQEFVLECYSPKESSKQHNVQNLLVTSMSVPEEQPVKAAEVNIEAKKELDGLSSFDKEFEFEQINHKGEVMQTAKNNEDGTVNFQSLYFLKEGHYNFTIQEKVILDAVGIILLVCFLCILLT